MCYNLTQGGVDFMKKAVMTIALGSCLFLAGCSKISQEDFNSVVSLNSELESKCEAWEDSYNSVHEQYNKLKKEARERSFDYSLLEKAQNQKEYNEMVKRAQQEYLNATILDRPIFDQGHCKANGYE